MHDWSDGYAVDIEYTHGFYRDMAPAALAATALMKGVQAPAIDRPFTYCELGCGFGLTSLVFAAANPHAEFYATDFLPAHVVRARRLAEEAKIGNVKYFEDSFGEFAERDLPSFDFITLHGIYSWVSPSVRGDIVNFIRKRLKPGGLVYISYNCQPGWATMAPLRRLFLEGGKRSGALSSMARLEAGLDVAKNLIGAGSAYFRANPDASGRFEKLTKLPKNYLVHEYMNESWEAFFFGDVATDLAEAKLSFVSSASMAEINLDTSVPQALHAAINAGADEVMRQTLRDFAVNRQFRADIFARGALPMVAREQMETFRATKFALIRARAQCVLKVALPAGEVAMSEATYAPILDALAEKARTPKEVATLPTCRHISENELFQAFRILLAVHYVHMAMPEEIVDAARPRCSSLNGVLLHHLLAGKESGVAAAPVIGSGLPAQGMDMIMLEGFRRGGDAPEAAVVRLAASRGGSLTKDGKGVTGDEALAYVREKSGAFRRDVMPMFEALGL